MWESRHDSQWIRKCWAEFNARFGIATYTDLPAACVDEAVQFVKGQYRALTGHAVATIVKRAAMLAGLEES